MCWDLVSQESIVGFRVSAVGHVEDGQRHMTCFSWEQVVADAVQTSWDNPEVMLKNHTQIRYNNSNSLNSTLIS